MPQKILIVEDDPALLKVLTAKIKSLGYVVIAAKDGVQAIKKFTSEPPDLVLLDIVLPIQSGFSVLEEIKIKLKSKVPVIILSNLSEPQDIETGKNLGAVDYIIKSNLTLKSIMVKVQAALASGGK
jgi:DNA-binding response OmpR family regulator